MIIIDKKEKQRVVGEVVRTISPGWWLIADNSGRQHRVFGSDTNYTGKRVVAVSGQIVGLHRITKKTKEVYSV